MGLFIFNDIAIGIFNKFKRKFGVTLSLLCWKTKKVELLSKSLLMKNKSIIKDPPCIDLIKYINYFHSSN